MKQVRVSNGETVWEAVDREFGPHARPLLPGGPGVPHPSDPAMIGTVTIRPGERFAVVPRDLVSVAEIAARAEVAWSTVQSWRRRHADFPAPIVRLAAGPIWHWSDVAKWIAVERKPGRPRKG